MLRRDFRTAAGLAVAVPVASIVPPASTVPSPPSRMISPFLTRRWSPNHAGVVDHIVHDAAGRTRRHQTRPPWAVIVPLFVTAPVSRCRHVFRRRLDRIHHVKAQKVVASEVDGEGAGAAQHDGTGVGLDQALIVHIGAREDRGAAARVGSCPD